MSIRPVLTNGTTSITEHKRNPMAVISEGFGEPVAVLNRNQPAFYCVPPNLFEAFVDLLDDAELVKLVKDRQNNDEVEVSIEQLQAEIQNESEERVG